MRTWESWGLRGAVLGGLLVVAQIVPGCTSKEPKPMQQPSVQDVRGNADRSFEKLKQEEQQRGDTGARTSPASGY